METNKGNDYYQFRAIAQKSPTDIKVDNMDMVERPFTDVRLCLDGEAVVRIFFEQLNEQHYEPGSIYENCVVFMTSRRSILRFVAQETRAEQITLSVPHQRGCSSFWSAILRLARPSVRRFNRV